MSGYVRFSLRSGFDDDTVVIEILDDDCKRLARSTMTPEQFGMLIAGNHVIECETEGKPK